MCYLELMNHGNNKSPRFMRITVQVGAGARRCQVVSVTPTYYLRLGVAFKNTWCVFIRQIALQAGSPPRTGRWR